MGITKVAEDIDPHRRRFLGAAAMTAAAAQLGVQAPADAQPAKTKLPAIGPGSNTSFGPLKQIDAGVLNVDTLRPVPPRVRRSFFCTAGATTFTAMSMSPLCWLRQATG